MRPLALPLAAALAAWPAFAAPSVALQGMLGQRALLVVNGGAPRAVAPGGSWQGVKVIATQGEQAVVEIEGQQMTLRVGEAPGKVQGSAPAASGRSLVLTADARGHFFTDGAINGRPIRFMVDTGASYVSLSESMAQNLGLDYKNAQRVNMATAGGNAEGWMMKLNQVRVSGVAVYNIDAVITPAAMPAALLGNSFLNHFSMERNGSRMELTKR